MREPLDILAELLVVATVCVIASAAVQLTEAAVGHLERHPPASRRLRPR